MNEGPTNPSEEAIAEAVKLVLGPLASYSTPGAPLSSNPLIRLFEEDWSHPIQNLLALMAYDQEVWRFLAVGPDGVAGYQMFHAVAHQLAEIIGAHWQSGMQRCLSLPDVAYYGRSVTKLYIDFPMIPSYSSTERREFIEWLLLPTTQSRLNIQIRKPS